MIYSNLNNMDEVLTSKAKKHQTCLYLEEIVGVYNLPCIGFYYTGDEEGNAFLFFCRIQTM